MTDVCVVTRPQEPEDGTFDPETGEVTVDPPEAVYGPETLGSGGRRLEGRCRVDVPRRDPDPGQHAGQLVYTSERDVEVPWDAPEFDEGDVLTIVASRNDPQLVDQEFTVGAVAAKSATTSRLVQVELRS